jgi:hypothetical protein
VALYCTVVGSDWYMNYIPKVAADSVIRLQYTITLDGVCVFGGGGGMCVCVCVCVCRERERERETNRLDSIPFFFNFSSIPSHPIPSHPIPSHPTITTTIQYNKHNTKQYETIQYETIHSNSTNNVT